MLSRLLSVELWVPSFSDFWRFRFATTALVIFELFLGLDFEDGDDLPGLAEFPVIRYASC
jgi:hypothetical protein